MNWKEKQIARLQQDNTHLELQRLANGQNVRYQVRMNRKRLYTTISEYTARKVFTTYAQNIILQLKIY